jgi:hypothetical protein
MVVKKAKKGKDKKKDKKKGKKVRYISIYFN